MIISQSLRPTTWPLLNKAGTIPARPGENSNTTHDATPILRIHLLRDFQLIYNSALVTEINQPRMQSLLAYLLLHYDAPQSRTLIAYRLWPDTVEGQAHTNLRTLLHRLRHALPALNHCLHVDRQWLQWQPDMQWTLDAYDFERAASLAAQSHNLHEKRAYLEEALSFYRGDLLPESYEEWLTVERDRLRQIFLNTLEELLNVQEQMHDFAAAIDTARHLLRHDPLYEQVYERLMALYIAAGNRTAALQIYRQCASTLRQMLGIEPGEAMRQIYAQLL